MTWEVRLSKDVARYLSRLEEKRRKMLRRVLEDFRENSFVGDVKPIKGRSGTYRRRVGSYRIIYSVDYEAHIVKVLKVGTRGDIYKSDI